MAVTQGARGDHGHLGRGAVAVLILTLLATSQPARADDRPEGEDTRPKVTFKWNAYALGLAQRRVVTRHSVLNPDNALARLPSWGSEAYLRPDGFIEFGKARLSAKPRLALRWSRIDGLARDEAGEADLLLNEARLQLGPFAGLHVMLGRENLQWGPSMSFSLSNPFFFDNGRSDPYAEVPGKDFAKLTYLPGQGTWGLTLIGNLGRGRDPAPDFRRTWAIKADWTGRTAHASLLASRRDGSRARLGAHAQVTANDALLLYAEGEARQGSDALRPAHLDDAPGWTMRAAGPADAVMVNVLLGLSYTFPDSSVLHVEYLALREGYDDVQRADFYAMGRELARVFTEQGPLSGTAARTLGQAAYPGLRLLGRNYVFGQYMRMGLWDQVDLIARWTHNLDDGSFLAVPIAEWRATSRLRVFALGAWSPGSRSREFSQYQRLLVNLGLQVHF